MGSNWAERLGNTARGGLGDSTGVLANLGLQQMDFSGMGNKWISIIMQTPNDYFQLIGLKHI